MQNSTIANLSIFTILVLVSGIFSMNGHIYAQRDSFDTAKQIIKSTIDNDLGSSLSALKSFHNNPDNDQTNGQTGTNDNNGHNGQQGTNEQNDQTNGQTGTNDNNGHNGHNGHNGQQGTVTRDMVNLLLEGKTLKQGDYISVYDSTPYKIITGHLVAKVPCTAKSQSEVEFLVGVAPNLHPINPELVSQLSNPAGGLCLYHVNLISDSQNTITDVAILNNSTATITFPQSTNVGVGVDKIAPLSQEQN